MKISFQAKSVIEQNAWNGFKTPSTWYSAFRFDTTGLFLPASVRLGEKKRKCLPLIRCSLSRLYASWIVYPLEDWFTRASARNFRVRFFWQDNSSKISRNINMRSVCMNTCCVSEWEQCVGVKSRHSFQTILWADSTRFSYKFTKV